MDKAEIDQNALELKKAIRPLAQQAFVTDGATRLEEELDFVVQRAPNPAHAKLADARLGNDSATKEAEADVASALNDVVIQIDYTLRNLENDGEIQPGGIRLKETEVQELKDILQEKRVYFSQFLDETNNPEYL